MTEFTKDELNFIDSVICKELFFTLAGGIDSLLGDVVKDIVEGEREKILNGAFTYPNEDIKQQDAQVAASVVQKLSGLVPRGVPAPDMDTGKLTYTIAFSLNREVTVKADNYNEADLKIKQLLAHEGIDTSTNSPYTYEEWEVAEEADN